MTTLSDVFRASPFYRIRRNHAMEHATLNLLNKSKPHLRLAGYSDMGGFWIVGNVEITDLQKAAGEALVRLQQGESLLAIHHNCGTNFAVPGMLAGTAAWLAMLGSEKDDTFGKKADRWGLVVTLVTLVYLFARPLGPKVQASVTTDARVDGMQIVEIIRSERGRFVVHRISTVG